MPVQGEIASCSIEDGTLFVLLVNSERGPVQLCFGEQAAFRDDRGLVGGACVELFELESSELLTRARHRRPVSLTEAFPLRHYQFLNAQGRPLLEVVSRKVRIAFKQAS